MSYLWWGMLVITAAAHWHLYRRTREAFTVRHLVKEAIRVPTVPPVVLVKINDGQWAVCARENEVIPAYTIDSVHNDIMEAYTAFNQAVGAEERQRLWEQTS